MENRVTLRVGATFSLLSLLGFFEFEPVHSFLYRLWMAVVTM